MTRIPLALSLLFALVAHAAAAMTDAEAVERFQRANDFHLEGRLEEARALYRDLLDHAPDDPTLLYNLGLTHQRQGELGWAVWAYEMALRQRPGWASARRNLSAVRPNRAPGTILTWPARWAQENFAPAVWTWAASAAWALAFIAAAGAILRGAARGQRALWWLTGLGVLLMVLSLVAFHLQRGERAGNPPSIVITPLAQVRTVPDPEGGSPLGELEEGERVWQMGEPSPSGWVRIRTAQDQVGHVDQSALSELTLRRTLP